MSNTSDLNDAPDLHAAIDTVARRFTAGDAPAHLRAVVVARLDDRRSPAWWRHPVPALAAAIVVALAGGVAIVQMRAPGADGTTTAVPALARVLTPAAPQTSVGSPELVTPRAPESAAVSRPPDSARASRGPSEAELAWHTRRIPALVAPDAMTFDEIQPLALTMPLLNVTPIVMPPIAPPADGGGSR